MTQSMISAGRAIVREQERGVKTETDPATHEDFRKRAFLDGKDPKRLTMQEVFEARSAGKLGDKDFTFWEKTVNSEWRDPKGRDELKQLHSFFEGIKSSITKSTPFAVNDQGERAFLRFKQDREDDFYRMRKAGVPIEEMLRTDGKFSFWRDLPKYTPTQQQALEALLEKARPSATSSDRGSLVPGQEDKPANFGARFDASVPAKWKPGMSMDDLTKLVGGK